MRKDWESTHYPEFLKDLTTPAEYDDDDKTTPFKFKQVGPQYLDDVTESLSKKEGKKPGQGISKKKAGAIAKSLKSVYETEDDTVSDDEKVPEPVIEAYSGTRNTGTYRRNRLGHEKADKLVSLFHNLRLLKRMKKPNYTEPMIARVGRCRRDGRRQLACHQASTTVRAQQLRTV